MLCEFGPRLWTADGPSVDFFGFPDPAHWTGWRGWLLRLDGLVGERGSTPREWRATCWRRRPARAARERVLAWKPDRLLVAHGACATESATPILARALAWM